MPAVFNEKKCLLCLQQECIFSHFPHFLLIFSYFSLFYYVFTFFLPFPLFFVPFLFFSLHFFCKTVFWDHIFPPHLYLFPPPAPGGVEDWNIQMPGFTKCVLFLSLSYFENSRAPEKCNSNWHTIFSGLILTEDYA